MGLTSQPDRSTKLRAWGIRVVHHSIDAVLRVSAGAVLNSIPAQGPDLEHTLPAFRQFLAQGNIDYQDLKVAPDYQQFIEAVATLHHAVPPSEPGAARAWWINLYNALVIHAVIAFGIRRSVWEDRGFFRRAAYIVSGHRMSADDIEHGILRENRPHPLFRLRQFAPGDPRRQWSVPLDPRVHFALVCGSRSCPAIRQYTAADLNAQLDAAAAGFIQGGGARVHPVTRTVEISRIFQWYQEDFGGRGGVIRFIGRYLDDPGAGRLLDDPRLVLQYLPYDWTLNGVRELESV